MREFDYSPHAHYENHYHIRELFEQQDKRVGDRQYHKDRIKNLEDRDDLINKAEFFITTDFWCARCKVDFKSQAVKQVEESWSDSTQRIAFYKTKCFKGHWVIKLITDRYKDPYWFRSRNVARDRGAFHNDTVQSFETGYNLLYGKGK